MPQLNKTQRRVLFSLSPAIKDAELLIKSISDCRKFIADNIADEEMSQKKLMVVNAFVSVFMPQFEKHSQSLQQGLQACKDSAKGIKREKPKPKEKQDLKYGLRKI